MAEFDFDISGWRKILSPVIFLYSKDSDHLLMSFNIIVFLVLIGPFKTFNPIKEDRLDVFECRIFPDLCQSLQPSKRIRPLSYARTFRRARGHRCSDITNQMGGEDIQTLHRSFM
jgi:hypothetical protein